MTGGHSESAGALGNADGIVLGSNEGGKECRGDGGEETHYGGKNVWVGLEEEEVMLERASERFRKVEREGEKIKRV